MRNRPLLRDYGKSMNWTTEYPTKPGYYWIRMGSGKNPEVAFVGPDMALYLIGNNKPQPLSIAPEWQGPIEPESEKRNRPEPYHIQGLACKDCGQTDGRFVSWILNTVDGRPIHGIICRECWIKRLTPEQRKVYMV